MKEKLINTLLRMCGKERREEIIKELVFQWLPKMCIGHRPYQLNPKSIYKGKVPVDGRYITETYPGE